MRLTLHFSSQMRPHQDLQFFYTNKTEKEKKENHL